MSLFPDTHLFALTALCNSNKTSSWMFTCEVILIHIDTEEMLELSRSKSIDIVKGAENLPKPSWHLPCVYYSF